MGAEEWHYADQWPPRGIDYATYYLHGDGTLSTDMPAINEAQKSYVYNPQDPVPTVGGRNLLIQAGSLDQWSVEPPTRNDVVVYTSDVLQEDVEVTGRVKVVLHASSNCTDTDFTAKLIDVYPDGSTMLILDGVIRARYRESTRYEVLMDPGTIYEFTLDLGDISQVFKAGHRIQVDISSSNFPRRDRNPNTGNPLYTDGPEDIIVAENTIYHDAEHPSYILLPVMSPKPKVFEGSAKIDAKELIYNGPAELHTYEHAVYLHFNDQWVKWDIIRYWQLKPVNVEFYLCEGKFGKLSVAVYIKKPTSCALAVGHKVFFYGKATYN
jgi:putative CocE/NonD family hydrolase